MILGPHSFGTWQSGQVARTPERLVIVDACAGISLYTFSCISWQEMQNCSVLVISMPC